MKRRTSQKKAIEQVFEQHSRPLKVAEVLSYGQAFVDSLNQATVYRNLKILVEEGWLVRVSHPNVGILYERANKKHHHHFYCNACTWAYDIPGCALNDNEAVAEGFIVESHEIFLFGVCPACNRAQQK